MFRTKAISYALLAVYEVGRQQKGRSDMPGISASEIAKKHHLPIAYTAKILSQLAGAQVLRSDRGPRGGFRLNRVAERISLYDIFASVGGITEEELLSSSDVKLPPSVAATVKTTCRGMAGQLRDYLTRTSLADILAKVPVNEG